jgi:hypothetical protein
MVKLVNFEDEAVGHLNSYGAYCIEKKRNIRGAVPLISSVESLCPQ